VDGTGKYDERVSPGSRTTRRCVFCTRESDADFVYCPYCGKRLDPRGGPRLKWYYSRYAVAVGLATAGPLALPLVWFHPRYRLLTKVLLTVFILVLTALILYGLLVLYMRLLEQVRQLMAY
jgi:hypothetical protein